jgi:hypothetical protein
MNRFKERNMNQGIKKFWFAGVAVLMAAVLVLAGCEIAAAPSWGPSPDTGTGRVTVSIGMSGIGEISPSARDVQGGVARTVYPALTGFAKYRVRFEPSAGGQAHEPVEITVGTTAEADLATGTYTVTVTGYTMVGGAETAAAEGTVTGVAVSAGNNGPVSVILGPIEGAGNGTFRYDITLADGLALTSGTLAITTEAGNAVEGGTVDLLTGDRQGTLTLAAGSYLAAVTLAKEVNSTEKYAGFSHEVVHIYAGLESALPAKAYDDSHFIMPVTGVSLNHDSLAIVAGDSDTLAAAVEPGNATNKAVTWTSGNTSIATVDENGRVTGVAVGNTTITVTTKDGSKTATCDVTVKTADGTYENIDSTDKWTAALTAISNAGNGSAGSPMVFDLHITGNFSVAGIGYGSSSITGTYKKVRLTGDKTISLSSKGSLIWTVANQTFMIDGPVLQGRADNNSPVVVVIDGAVEFRSGEIKGNTCEYNGGGVYVEGTNATFTMAGGTISGNKGYGGGGVYVYSDATFIMKGGTISGNSTYASGNDGGGVYVGGGTNPTFTMEGGTISNNWCHDRGGGVYVHSGGTFTVNDGTISENTATSGNGVYVLSGGTFNQNGGTVSDDVVKQ